jgi:hypothetical protein
MGPSVQVVSNTWARDSHDLFDFEAHHLQTKTFNVLRSAQFVRNGTDVQMLGGHAIPPPSPAGAEQLLKLVQKDGTFWVDKGVPSSSSKKLWLVVRDLPTAGHKLSEGDVIKLGRFKFRARQLVTSTCEDIQPELRLDDTGAFCSADPSTMDELKNTNCRICLLEGSTEEDPLIRPCQCKGSIEYVHLGCLRHWVKGRLNLSDAPGGSYFYRPLPCELCKAPYPAYFKMNDLVESLVEVPKTTPPYIVLENMVRDSHQHSTRGLHVLSLAENKLLKLGRGHESDVRIADVSISRCHATIRLHQGSFLLEDNQSKFGTLVAMKKPRPLTLGSPFSIQIGRTVLGLALKTPDESAIAAAIGTAIPGQADPSAAAPKDEEDPNRAA